MNDKLVVIHNNEPRAGTYLIAKGFEREHKKVLELIEKYRKEFETFGPLNGRKVPTLGRPISEFLLDEDQYIFLGTLLRNSPVTVPFKLKVVLAFKKTRKKLESANLLTKDPETQKARVEGKVYRLKETDIIKEFVEYARAQGSSSPEKYFIHFTNLVQDLLFHCEGKFKVVRNFLTPTQLLYLSNAEAIVAKGLRDEMKMDRRYKKVYQNIKSRVEAYVGLVGQQEVLAPELLKLEEG